MVGDVVEIEEDTEDGVVMTKVVVVTIRVAEVTTKDTEGATVAIEEAVEVITMTVEDTEEIEGMVVTAMIAEVTAITGDMVVTVVTVVVTIKTIKVALAENEVGIVIIGTETEVFKEVAGRNKLPILQRHTLSVTN